MTKKNLKSSQIDTAQLIEKLNLTVVRIESRNYRCECLRCGKPKMGVSRSRGVARCWSCDFRASPYKLALELLGDKATAKQLMIDVGEFSSLGIAKSKGKKGKLKAMTATVDANSNTPGKESPTPAATSNSTPGVDQFDAIATVVDRVCEEKGIGNSDWLRAYGAIGASDGHGSACVRIPAYSPAGKYQAMFRIWPGSPTQDEELNATLRKGIWRKNDPQSLFLPQPIGWKGWTSPRLPTPGEHWHLCEGAKDAAVLAGEFGLRVAGQPGCDCPSIGFESMFADCRVTIVPDADHAGIVGAWRTAQRLHAAGAEVFIVIPPVEILLKHGLDCRDILSTPGGKALLQAALDGAMAWVEAFAGDKLKPIIDAATSSEPPAEDVPPADQLPIIVIDHVEHRVIDEAIQALAERGRFFQKNGRLVHVVRDALPLAFVANATDTVGLPRLAPVKLPRLRDELTRVAEWRRRKGDDLVPATLNDWLPKGIEAREHWPGIRPITGVIDTPTLRPDGTIILEPGYDQQTGLLFEPSADFSNLHGDPTQADAVQAITRLFDVVVDFPFVESVHKAAWLASLLTNFARYAYRGPTPFSLIDANTRGSGKGLLADTIALIATGQPMPVMSQPQSDEEMRKRITSLMMSGATIISLDNLTGNVGWPSLDAALTGSTWSDRALGGNTVFSGDIGVLFYATGNNLALAADTARRALHIRIESEVEKPEFREGFKHPDLRGHILANRPQLIAAALTILRAYCLAGRPIVANKPWGSFERWSRLVRQAVAWVTGFDPGETRQELASRSDTEAIALKHLIESWTAAHQAEGVTASSVLGQCRPPTGKLPDLRSSAERVLHDAICDFCPGRNGELPSPRSLGSRLGRIRRRVVDGKHFDSKPTNHGEEWFVESSKSS